MNTSEAIMELFFNEPTKHWHFEEILKIVKISRPQTAYWLKQLVKEGLIKRIKPKGKMPHYIAHYENPAYQAKKRLFALSQLEKTGFLQHLMALPKAQTIIIFGSMGRWDWYSGSDIDIFVYGSAEGFDYGTFRKRLHRDLQFFICENKKELARFNRPLLRNVLEGYLVKGTLNFVEVMASA